MKQKYKNLKISLKILKFYIFLYDKINNYLIAEKEKRNK